MKKQAFFYILILSFLMTQFNNCSPADITSSEITSLNTIAPIAEEPIAPADPNDPSEDQPPKPFYKLDFENGGANIGVDLGIQFSTSVAVKELSTPDGAYLLRSNFREDVKDLQTEKLGSLKISKMSHMDIASNTPNEVYLKFRFKFDSVIWDPATPDNAVYAKMFLSKDGTEESSFLIILQGGPNGKVKVWNQYSGGDVVDRWGNWLNSPLGWRAGGGSASEHFYAETKKGFGSDGVWHKFELYIKYGVDRHQAQILIDGWPIKDDSGVNVNSDGYFNLPPQFKLEHFTLFETEAPKVVNAQTKLGAAGQLVGVEIDDIQIWDHRPLND